MKKQIATLLLITSLFLPSGVKADGGEVLGESTEEVCVETTVYGGGVGVVCGTKTHEPVDTAIGDNPFLLASTLLASSYGLYKFGRKTKKASQIA